MIKLLLILTCFLVASASQSKTLLEKVLSEYSCANTQTKKKDKYILYVKKRCKENANLRNQLRQLEVSVNRKKNKLEKVEYFDLNEAKGDKTKKVIVYYKNGIKAKEEFFGYTSRRGARYEKRTIDHTTKYFKQEDIGLVYANGDRYKKQVAYYQNGKLLKQEGFDYTSNDGDRIRKSLTYYKNGKRFKEEAFDYVSSDGDKIRKIITYYKNKKKAKEEFFDFKFSNGNKLNHGITYYENGYKNKQENFNFMYANGNKYKKRMTYYKNGKRLKEEDFGYTYADGDSFRKGIFYYKDEKMVREEILDYFLKEEQKTYDKVILKREGKKRYYYKGELIKTRSLR